MWDKAQEDFGLVLSPSLSPNLVYNLIKIIHGHSLKWHIVYKSSYEEHRAPSSLSSILLLREKQVPTFNFRFFLFTYL